MDDPLLRLAAGELIVAHEWDKPWGICPCGWLVSVREEDDEKTCPGCKQTHPIARMDGARNHERLNKLSHLLHAKAFRNRPSL